MVLWFRRQTKEQEAQEIFKQDAKYRAMSEKLEEKYANNTAVQNNPDQLNQVIAKRIKLILRVNNKDPNDIKFITDNKEGTEALIARAPKSLIGYRRLMKVGNFYMEQIEALPAKERNGQKGRDYADLATKAYDKAAKMNISPELSNTALAEQIIASKKSIESKLGSWQEQAHELNKSSLRANISMGDMQTDRKKAITYYENALGLTSGNKYKIHEKLLEIYSNPKYNADIQGSQKLAIDQFYKAEREDKGKLRIFMLKGQTINSITQKPDEAGKYVTDLRKNVTEDLVKKINPTMPKEERERSMEMLVGLYAPVTNLSSPTEISPEGRTTAYLELVKILTDPERTKILTDTAQETINKHIAQEFLRKASKENPNETERFMEKNSEGETILADLIKDHQEQELRNLIKTAINITLAPARPLKDAIGLLDSKPELKEKIQKFTEKYPAEFKTQEFKSVEAKETEFKNNSPAESKKETSQRDKKDIHKDVSEMMKELRSLMDATKRESNPDAKEKTSAEINKAQETIRRLTKELIDTKEQEGPAAKKPDMDSPETRQRSGPRPG